MKETTKIEEAFRPSKNHELFHLVKDKDKSIIITVGRYKVSKHKFATFESADKYIGRKPWELLVNTMQLMNEFYYNESKENSAETKKD